MTKIEDNPAFLGDYCCKEFENDVLNNIIRYDKSSQYEPFILTIRKIKEKLFDELLQQEYYKESRVDLKHCPYCGLRVKGWNELFQK